MTGAYNFTAYPDGVRFQLKAKTKNGSNTIRVKLDPSDTYTVEFGTYRNKQLTVKETISDIYCDMLQNIIEQQTGLYLSL